MPLIHSSSKPAFVSNLKAELAAGKPRDQALAISYRIKREKRATGGSVPHVGAIHSAVPGRTDHLALDVPAGSYVVTADVVSALGQGNTAAGLEILRKRFPAPSVKGKTTPIMAAGGEYVIPPDEVMKIGKGDLDHGHSILDKWMMNEREKLVKTLKNLPGPAKT